MLVASRYGDLHWDGFGTLKAKTDRGEGSVVSGFSSRLRNTIFAFLRHARRRRLSPRSCHSLFPRNIPTKRLKWLTIHAALVDLLSQKKMSADPAAFRQGKTSCLLWREERGDATRPSKHLLLQQ